MDEEEFSNVTWDIQDNTKHDTLDPLSDITDSLNQPIQQQPSIEVDTQQHQRHPFFSWHSHFETFRDSTSLRMEIQHLP